MCERAQSETYAQTVRAIENSAVINIEVSQSNKPNYVVSTVGEMVKLRDRKWII